MMSSGIPSRMWFSSHSNVWSSVASVVGNEERETHFPTYPRIIVHMSCSILPLVIPERQLEAKCRTNKH